MPAFTNSRLGSSNSSGALGTTVWPLSPKNRNHRRRISAVSMGSSSQGRDADRLAAGSGDGARAGGADAAPARSYPRGARVEPVVPVVGRADWAGRVD